jgi:putative flippase GtrA
VSAVAPGRSSAVHKDELVPGPDARGTTTTSTLSVGPSLGQLAADVEVVVPVHNEQDDLAASVGRLYSYLTRNFPLTWLITIVDNASTDSTWAIACRLARDVPGVRALYLAQKGRGRALRTAWLQSEASVVAYMDVDLSTGLDALLPLVAPLTSGHSDVAIGSRLASGARVVRGPKREFISRMYNFILRATLHNSFSDAQCGFKAMRAEAARQLVPLVEDDQWFFDTELLVLAERNGFRVHEVAVDWVDDAGSTVDIVRTARDDLKGIVRMMFPRFHHSGHRTGGTAQQPPDLATSHRPRPGPAGELVHFAGAGMVSTLSFAVLFALLYGTLGAVGAVVVALALCATGNLVANRRFTFASRGPAGRQHNYLGSFGLALLPLASTLGALLLMSAAGVASLPVDILVLTAAVLVSSLARFLFLRRSARNAP